MLTLETPTVERHTRRKCLLLKSQMTTYRFIILQYSIDDYIPRTFDGSRTRGEVSTAADTAHTEGYNIWYSI